MTGLENRVHDAFEPVKASQELKQATLDFLAAEREERTHRRSPRIRPLAACAVLVLVFLGLGGWQMACTPVSYVSIDVNPSVELELNRLDRVLSATAYNSDGERVLAGLDLVGQTYTNAVDTLLNSPAMAPYLTETSALTVTVAADSEAREAALLAGLQSCAGYQNHGGRSCCADPATLSEAHGCGMSFGKYAASQELMACDGTVTQEDCSHMTMAEIWDRLDACHHGENSTTGTGAGHHGWGQSGGHHGWGHE